MTTTIARENDTSMAFPEGNSSWRPLAIALPVCLVGIPLITVLIIVIFTCYRSKFKHKNSVFGRKLNDENSDQNEAADVGNETRGNQTDNSTSLTTVYANLSETVEEAREKEAMGDSTSNGFSKSLHWPLKRPWKKRKPGEAANITENTKADKDPTTDITDHKERGEDETEKEAGMIDEARSNGRGMNGTPGKTTAETAMIGNLLMPKTNGKVLGLHGVPMRQKNEMTKKNQYTDNAITTTARKPSQTENRKTFVVMYSMDSDEANHLSLDVNDVIFFMDEEKDGWMKGEKKESGEIGWFPRTHVREGMSPLVKKPPSMVEKTEISSETDKKATTSAPRITMATIITSPTMVTSDNETDTFEDFDDDDDDDDDYETGIEFQALYPYRATEDGDINFDAGDVIVVVEKQDNGWWRGYHGDDHGFFPGSYVQILPTDESIQSLIKQPQATGHAAGDAGQLDDPEMLLTVSEEEEVDDDDDALRQNKNKNKMKSARRSIGVFLMSLPRRIATSNRTAGDGGHGGSPVVTSDPSSDPVKAKKSDRVIIPGVTKKKKKNKNKKMKNAHGQRPNARRSSLAPGPPQSGPQGAAVGALVKNVMSGLAHLVAAEAQLRSDPLDTTYEEIGTTELFDPARSSQSNLSEGNYDSLLNEILRATNSSDVMTNGKSSMAESLVLDTKRSDVISSQANAGTYSNLDCAVQSAATAAKDSYNRRGHEDNKRTTRTEDNKQQREIKNKEQSKQLGPSPWKPVPPQKPRYIGSTPNISELLSSIERGNEEGIRRSPGNKPRTLAKPGRPKSGRGHASDLGLTGADLRWGLPPSQKPKPLKEKPRYLSPGFPQGVAPQSDLHQMRRRDIYRSLDSVRVAADADDGTTDEDEAGGELEIMKWLRKKLSVEDELIGKEAGGGAEEGRGEGGGSQLNGGGKKLQEMQVGRMKDISDGTPPDVESKDGARIVIMFESLTKAGLNEESFV